MGLDISFYEVKRVEIHSQNITHNLTDMAREATLYVPLWRPEELGITKARQLIKHLRMGIEFMEAEPDKFKAHDSPNGWGTYADFLPWLKELLQKCEEYPDAELETSR